MSEVRQTSVRAIWPLLLLASAGVVSLVEMSLLAVGTGLFGVGFNSPVLDAPGRVASFAILSLIVDAGFLLVMWAVLTPVIHRMGLSGLRAWWILVVVSVGPLCLIAAYRYNVYAIAGQAFNVALIQHGSMSSSSSMAGELFGAGFSLWMIPAALGLLAIGVVARWLGALDRRHPGWRPALAFAGPGRSLLTGVGIVLAVALLTRVVFAVDSPIRFGLERKGADIATHTLLASLTDLDQDGFGPFSALPDPDPFDAAVHPYAIEIPDNGIDENGLAGDLARNRVRDDAIEAPLPTNGPRPHLLVLYLESFRQDLLGSVVDGRPVVPFLDQLAAEGASTDQAFTHTAWTLDSRAQLFTGRVDWQSGQPTLIDDFKALGYEVLHFSGQDESYGDSEAVLGVARADTFYDARQDLERRSSRTTTPVSLQVSWKVLSERISQRLDAYAGERPLFLYANLTDTHFPYVHHELDDILGVEPLERAMIRADRAEDVRRGYANTAANVDRGAAHIVARFREAIGHEDHAIVVLADHGEAFYERGRLGHGQTVDDSETRIPLVLWGLGGEWPEPIAPSDLRALLRRNLGLDRDGGRPTARFVPSPSRQILQYAPSLDRPRVVALRSGSGTLRYDLERDEMHWEPSAGNQLPDVAASPGSRFDELIWRWEDARATTGPRRRGPRY